MAWGTLCLLAVVQMGIVIKLLTAKSSSISGSSPMTLSSSLPSPTPSVVPEIGQIAAPPPASTAPPLPGSLMPQPAPIVAPPVSSAPPPIGSFNKTDAPMPVPAAPVLPPASSLPTAPAAPPLPPVVLPATTSAPTIPPLTTKPDAATELLRDVNYVVTSAKEIRGMSDMQGALELLKRADQLTPDHPAIIAELAQTYEQMGIKDKATDSWRRIQLLGTTKAGSFYELASRRLGAGSAAVAAPLVAGAAGMESEKLMRLGACQVARDFSVNAGERYVLRVPIVRAGNQPIDGKAVNLEVFFFDRINGVKVVQTIAPEPVETWQSAPVDWSGGTGEETLDVVYHLPALSAAEIQQHGRRSYYGYMLRLYYNNKLQDVAAEPRDLLEFGSAPGAAPAGANPLLPPVGR